MTYPGAHTALSVNALSVEPVQFNGGYESVHYNGHFAVTRGELVEGNAKHVSVSTANHQCGVVLPAVYCNLKTKFNEMLKRGIIINAQY